ncbi:hypothetical protein O181_002574 [Austropuccinia psidii MF-1]|uniref:Glutathione synthetase n=1 Tax=Austropuccinia psidii MF-1 TaxID=1389203 RepID=A0A9Q3BCP2_9BASI|nr:hypothetical protein [Austropuccinia psidii MF-1]
MIKKLPLPWSSSLDSKTVSELRKAAITYALTNSLIIRPSLSISTLDSIVIHAPFCLFPSTFPQGQFEKALRLQTAYNQLYANLACNPNLIREVIGKIIAKVDLFIGKFYEIWEKVENDGKSNSHLSLGIFRSDYLLHQENLNVPLEIKQVEFNTVSVSFGGLGTKISELHRYLASLTTALDPTKLPNHPNHALYSLSNGLRRAHETYLESEAPVGTVVILMIVQENERNQFDQSLLEYQLAEESAPIRLVRVSCHLVLQSTQLDPDTKKLYYISNKDKVEVSVVYYRSMYGPEDFLSENDWNGRYQLERSRAINCPNLSTQLVGCKKFQQVITEQDFLEKYHKVITKGISQTLWNEVRSTWAKIYSLESNEGFNLASDPSHASSFVLKPQREGGGNNIYGQEIPRFVSNLEEEKRAGYILMSLIQTLNKSQNYLIQSKDSSEAILPREVISELGIFGVCLFKRDCLDGANLIHNIEAGHLLRTKNCENDEGGVASGFSCLDSPLMV